MTENTSASTKAAGDAKGLGKKLDTDDTTKLETKKETQNKDEGLEAPVKPKLEVDVMSSNVTFEATAIKHMPDGVLAVVSTSAGDLIVPSQSFATGELPREWEQEEGGEPQKVTVTASYARSMGLI